MESTYHQLFLHSSIPSLLVYPLGEKFIIYEANLSYQKLTGMSNEQLSQQSIFELFPDSNTNESHAGNRILQEAFAEIVKEKKHARIAEMRFDVEFDPEVGYEKNTGKPPIRPF